MISNIQWQEWSFRVGCWLLVLLGHLWLLLVNPATPLFSSSAQSGVGGSELSLSFVQAKSPDNHGYSTAIEPAVQVNKQPALAKKRLTKQVDSSRKAKTQKPSLKKSTKKLPTEETFLDKQLVNEKANNDTVEQVTNISSSGVQGGQAQEQEQTLGSAVTKNQDKTPNLPVIETTIYKPSLVAPPVPPRYPEIARKKKQQGTVWLDIFLDRTGEQKQLLVYQSSGVRALDKAAIAAVKQWQFSQRQKEYQAHLVKIRIPIEFSLN